MLNTLFIDSVWSTSFYSNLKEYCLNIRKQEDSSGRKFSNRGGYQSNDLNLSDTQLQPLINHILSETSKFSSTYNFSRNNFYIKNMWVNINGYKDYNIPHTHPGSQFSGVYYVDTPHDPYEVDKNGGNIVFRRGHIGKMGFDWNLDFTEWNQSNSAIWHLSSDTHNCYIFPSYLEHYVDPNLSKEKERISISFNVALLNS